MRKLLIIAACAIMSLTANAGTDEGTSKKFFSAEKSKAKSTFGLRLGGNLANISGDVIDTDSRLGLNAGVSIDIPVLESLYIYTGLYAAEKGFEVEAGSEKMEAKPLFLDIPVLASYRYNFNSSTQLQVDFGPYFAYGLSGKVELESGGSEYKQDCFDNSNLKRFDYGIQMGTGITVKRIYAGIAYQIGLNDLNDTKENGDIHNRNFIFNIGYKL